MVVYADLMILLNFSVDFLLLMGANRIVGHRGSWRRAAMAAIFGAIYACACMMTVFSFLSTFLCRLLSLAIMSGIAFGWNRSSISKGTLFALLSMALGGIALGLQRSGFVGILASAAVLLLLCVFGFQQIPGQRKHIPVEIHYNKDVWHINALHDTGNALRDPVTGQQVLVVGADVAREILGLSQQQLNTPVETLRSQNRPGLRLIPYRTVGLSGGMLLAAQMDQVLIAGRQSGRLVAFAPQILDTESTYQALAGGII